MIQRRWEGTVKSTNDIAPGDSCAGLRYEVDETELAHGSSLGNAHGWINTGTDGRIQTLFSTEVGEEVAGPLMVRYCGAEARVAECRGEVCCLQANAPLTPIGGGRFVIRPASQQHVFRLPGGVEVTETVFMPQVEGGDPGHDCVAYCRIELTNRSQEAVLLKACAYVRMRGTRRTPVMGGAFDGARGALFVSEPDDNPDWVRVLGATVWPSAYSLTTDFACTSETEFVAPLDGDTSARGDLIGCLQVDVDLPPGATESFAFILSFTPAGVEAAGAMLDTLGDVDAILCDSERHVAREIDTCRILTPGRAVNEGGAWAKVNMMRVLADYPEGEAFTNEPGVSSNVVVRDVAWFIYGCDHFRPESSRRMIETIVRKQYDSGKIPEYYNARTGVVEDYGLNINDGTPLFVLAVNHHVRSTGDAAFLAEVYDAVARACRYILSQRDERGLVFCTAEGLEVWGIASWRNVIPNYRINGAVTEINAECAAALRAMGHMAENLGRGDDAEEFTAAARELTDAVNEHLLDRDRQLYLLNIDTEGVRHTDVTADELFPVLFRIADEEVAYRIVRRLNSPDFWTPAGLRTTSRQEPLYDPARHVGLTGGVWPGATWWYAFAAARYHPEFMVKALQVSYEHYNRNPRVFNTVPGQFSEWFDGESLVNRGMRLSPWEPPRFLWAALEGVCGLMVSVDEPGIRPLLPPDWKWVAAVNVRYHGGLVTFFAARESCGLHVYANTAFQGCDGGDVFAHDVTDRLRIAARSDIHPVALSGDDRVLVAIGSSSESATTVVAGLSDVLDADAAYELRQFSSERGDWTRAVAGLGSAFATLAVRLETQGYHLLDFVRTGGNA